MYPETSVQSDKTKEMSAIKLTANKKVIYDDFSHTYLCGDKVLKGVTTLMKEHDLSANYGDVDENVLRAAARRGSAVHKMLEDYDNGESIVTQDVEYDGKVVITAEELEANLKAYKKLGLNVISSEFLISDNKMVASSIDKVLYNGTGDSVDLADVKTTSTLHIKALEWQLGIYKYLLEKQCKKVKVDKCYAIHIRKGEAKFVLINPVGEDRVKSLFDAEKKGVKYQDVAPTIDTSSLIISEEDVAMMVGVDRQLAELAQAKKELEAQVAGLKDRIYQFMVEKNIVEMDLKGGYFKLKKPYQKTSVDSKKLKEKYPDIAEECSVTTEVKGSISWTAKEE